MAGTTRRLEAQEAVRHLARMRQRLVAVVVVVELQELAEREELATSSAAVVEAAGRTAVRAFGVTEGNHPARSRPLAAEGEVLYFKAETVS